MLDYDCEEFRSHHKRQMVFGVQHVLSEGSWFPVVFIHLIAL